MRANAIDMGHARALLTLPTGQQGEVAKRIADKRLSVRETESLVNSLLKTMADGQKQASVADPDIARLEQRMAEHLGAGVRIQHGRKGLGKLVISYGSLEQLEGLLARLGG